MKWSTLLEMRWLVRNVLEMERVGKWWSTHRQKGDVVLLKG